MRITLVSYGSEGDTRPFVALGRGLMAAGHEVLLFGEQSSLSVAGEGGVPMECLAGDVRAVMPVMGPGVDPTLRQVFKTLKDLNGMIRDSTSSWMSRIADHAGSSDGILYSGLAYCHGEAVALGLGKPGIGLGLQPIATTREFSSWALPPMQLPGWLNRLSYAWSITRALQKTVGKRVNAARTELFGTHAATSARSPLTLYGISRHLMATPADWPSTHRICGHWALHPENYHPSPPLEEFLAAGGAPIYVGLGTASSFLGHSLLKTIVAAVAGRRALFYPGWSMIDSTALPANFFVLEHVPHTWLFPRVSMVMHHCGAGTTHSACRAGVPSIALPLGGDQPHWALRLSAAGVAAKHTDLRKLTVGSLEAMIAVAERRDTRERAQALGAAMGQEQGVAKAVELVEAHISGLRTSRQSPMTIH